MVIWFLPRVSPTTITAFGNIGTNAQGTMLKSDGTTGVYDGGAISVAVTPTVTTCTVGSISITLSGDPSLSPGDWVSTPACGISAAQVDATGTTLVLQANLDLVIVIVTVIVILQILDK